VVLAVVGVTTSGSHSFPRAAASLVVAGLALLAAIGTAHRRTRRALIRRRPDLAEAVARRRVWWPGGQGPRALTRHRDHGTVVIRVGYAPGPNGPGNPSARR
jgi:hypothetical protein